MLRAEQSFFTKWRGRLPSQDLGNDGGDIGQLLLVGERRKASSAHDTVELFLSGFLRLRVLYHAQEERADYGDGGVRTALRSTVS